MIFHFLVQFASSAAEAGGAQAAAMRHVAPPVITSPEEVHDAGPAG
jgi:hypothetical protein